MSYSFTKSGKAAGMLIDFLYVFLGRIFNMPDHPSNKNGGYFCIRDRKDNRVLLMMQVGEVAPEKVDMCFALAQEKGERLFEMRGLHKSSWQSRNPEADKWGGAIIVGDLILSFSGLPELADEAAMLRLARSCNWISEEDATYIASLSCNTVYSAIRE